VKRLALLAIALTGCGDGGAPAPALSPSPAATGSTSTTERTVTGQGVSTMTTTTTRALGTTSGLTGQTSALTGRVSDFVVERTETETRVALAADTLFAFDQATLTPAAQANLQRTADLVREGGQGPVTVVGHTDAKGEDAYNLDLSRRRAQAVATWLRGQAGLGNRSYAVEGRGEAEPVASNARPDGGDDPDGRARNRRVVVIIPR
jgi:outer membrane protein OmpA-like peptidoglycan-associated protein